MYEYVRGSLVESLSGSIVVETGGIGYRIVVPASLVEKLPEIEQEVKIFTSWVVRETSQTLFGFLAPQERELFEILITLSGIGPKTAVGILGHLDLARLQDAVYTKNVLAFSKVPGIGKKTAERLIVDLRDKILKIVPLAGEAEPLGSSAKIRDALGALINLGFTESAAKTAVSKALEELPEESALSDIITLALQSK